MRREKKRCSAKILMNILQFRLAQLISQLFSQIHQKLQQMVELVTNSTNRNQERSASRICFFFRLSEKQMLHNADAFTLAAV